MGTLPRALILTIIYCFATPCGTYWKKGKNRRIQPKKAYRQMRQSHDSGNRHQIRSSARLFWATLVVTAFLEFSSVPTVLVSRNIET